MVKKKKKQMEYQLNSRMKNVNLLNVVFRI